MNITETVADYINNIEFCLLSDEVIERTKVCLLDWLAVTLAGSREETARIIANTVKHEGAGEASIIGTDRKTTPLMAALVNGTAAHALDYDDAYQLGSGHASAPVISAAYPLAESMNVKGRDLITAIATGIHVMFSIGAGLMPEHYQAGWHNTGTIGHFGAAAATGKLLGLSKEKLITALGIAGTQASGLRASFGSMCKPFHAGKAAMNGLLSSQLALAGFTGPTDVLGTRYGVCDAMMPGSPRFDSIRDFLLGKHQVSYVLYKHYPSCFGTHAAIESAFVLRNEHHLNPADIKSIRCIVYPTGLDAAYIKYPQSGLQGKFSIPFCVALALLKGKVTLQDFNDETVSLPEVVSLIAKTETAGDDAYSSTRSTTIIMTMKDGIEYQNTINLHELLADFEKQKQDVIEKFKNLSSTVLEEKEAYNVLQGVLDLEKTTDLTPIFNNVNKTKTALNS